MLVVSTARVADAEHHHPIPHSAGRREPPEETGGGRRPRQVIPPPLPRQRPPPGLPAHGDDLTPRQRGEAEVKRAGKGRAAPGALSAMSGGGPTSPSRSGAAPLSSDRKREALAAGSPIQPIIKDVGEIYSRLLDHRPVIQGEIRYFVKEFEDKRGLRELRVLGSLKNTIFEANEHVLPQCEQTMHDSLGEAFQRCHLCGTTGVYMEEQQGDSASLSSLSVTS
ncbi:biogenesis of lysosome-related organelles complex 1 subunit 5 isoform 2-T2 [Porphyrio hochstetteri]